MHPQWHRSIKSPLSLSDHHHHQQSFPVHSQSMPLSTSIVRQGRQLALYWDWPNQSLCQKWLFSEKKINNTCSTALNCSSRSSMSAASPLGWHRRSSTSGRQCSSNSGARGAGSGCIVSIERCHLMDNTGLAGEEGLCSSAGKWQVAVAIEHSHR